jgi:integrase
MRVVSQPDKRKLTDVMVRKEQKRGLIWDTHQRGLVLRIRARKTWQCIYRANGKVRWYRIGDAGAIGLADARVMAAEIMLAVAKGGDPAAERRAKRSAGTFGELATKYVEQHAKKHNKSWKQAAQLVRRYGTERWGKLPAESISRTDVRGVLSKLKPVMANQVLAAISAVFSWAVSQDQIETNPCTGIKRNQTQSRERILSDGEIPQFWEALDDVLDPVTVSALKVILLCGQRPGEVSNMRYEHLKDGFWELPGAPSAHWPGTKNGSSHRVALSAPVRALIDALADGAAPASGYVFEVEPGRPVSRTDRGMREVSKKLGIDPVTPHDLRRTCASTIAALGFGRQAIDRILNHADKSITATYDRYSYAKEDQTIMETVANKIIGLVEGRADAKVVPLRK